MVHEQRKRRGCDRQVLRVRPLGGRNALTLTIVAAVLTALVAALGAGRASAKSGPAPTAVFEVQPFNAPDSVDPALSYTTTSWQIAYATCLKLINYPDLPAPAGSVPAPEASQAPKISSDGLTYTFTVPAGKFQFAPPSNELVTASTFRSSFRRTLAPFSGSSGHDAAVSYASVIEGASAYAAGSASDISGITLKADKLSIRLTAPTPDFLARLAMPFFCAVPSNAPAPAWSNAIPSAGPYSIASADPSRIVLKANPNYRGKRPHAFGEIDYLLEVPDSQIEADIASGAADYAVTGIPAGDWAAVAAAVGPGSPAAMSGRQQMFVNPQLSLRYLALNSRPGRLFHNRPELRKAVNLAINRAVLAASSGAFGSTPIDQVLTPGMPGFRDVQIYPLDAPDLARANALAAPFVPATAELYTSFNAIPAAIGFAVASELAAFGITVNVHQFPRGEQLAREATPGEPFDIGVEGWIADSPDPYFTFAPLLRGGSPSNFGGFDEPLWNDRIDAAQALYGTARYDAFAALDEDIMRDAAPVAPIGTINSRDYFSARIGCQTFSPPFGMNIAALCIR